MQLEDIIKSMQALQDEVAKSNETIEQLNQTLERMNLELEETFEKEKEELASVESKWNAKREELTKEISDATQKKKLIEDQSASTNAAVKLVEALFLKLQESIPKADVIDAIGMLREKYDKSAFESKSPDDLSPDDFDEFEQELDLIPQLSDEDITKLSEST